MIINSKFDSLYKNSSHFNKETTSLLNEIYSVYKNFIDTKELNNSNYNKVVLNLFKSFNVSWDTNTINEELKEFLDKLNKLKTLYPLKNKQDKNIIFLGSAGSGKTSLLRYIQSVIKLDYASFISEITSLNFNKIKLNEEFINKTNEFLNGPKLFIKDGNLKVKSKSNLEFDLSNLSSSEKTILYYLVKILLNKEKLFYFIDEPLVNNSSLVKLFNYLETKRKDSIFIYLTSDIKFAKSRKNSSIYLLQKYETYNKWLFTPLVDDNELPTSLLLNLNNNTKPILFCESEDESKYDYLLFSKMFKDYNVFCAKGCTNVISNTKAIKKLHLKEKVYGIIDRDYLLESKIKSLRRSNILVLPTFEIENFLCIDSFLYLVFKSVTLNYEDYILKIKENLFNYFKKKEENIILNFVVTKINANSFNIKEKDNTSLSSLLEKYEVYKDKIDPIKIYNDYKDLFKEITSVSNYFLILKYCDIKNEIINIINNVGKKLNPGFNYKRLLFSLLDTNEGEEILKKVRSTFFKDL